MTGAGGPRVVLCGAFATVVAAVAGCSRAAPTPPVRPTLAALCARHVTYWAAEAAAGHPDPGDYQEMGLVAAEYTILRAVITAQHEPGAAAHQRARVEALCVARFGRTATALPAASGPAWPSG